MNYEFTLKDGWKILDENLIYQFYNDSDNDVAFEKAIEKAGYFNTNHRYISADCSIIVQVYAANTKKDYSNLILITDFCADDKFVFVKDFPDLLALLNNVLTTMHAMGACLENVEGLN